MKSIIQKKYIRLIMVLLSILPGIKVFAAEAPVPADTTKPVAQLLLAIIIALLFVIILMANVVLSVAKHQLKKQKESAVGTAAKLIAVVVLSVTSIAAQAQEATSVAVSTPPNYGGLSATSFWGLMSVVLIEVVVILILAYNLKFLLKFDSVAVTAKEENEESLKEKGPSTWEKIWFKINSFKSIKEESSIDLGHDYDGIRELDNRLPPWWLYGFYLTIIVAAIYLYRYHVAYSAPLSSEEFKIAMQKGEEEKAAYLKQAANNIDETNVTLLTEVADIEVGKAIFVKTCATCHKADAGGMVGPNLTDDYWVHGGSVQDIFKTIKYGVPEKGMQAWKDNYSPKQIAQLVSFIKSIKGSNPPGAKEPQGTLYTEQAAAPTRDSAAAKALVDSAKAAK